MAAVQNVVNMEIVRLHNSYVSDVMRRLSAALPNVKSELNSLNSYTFLIAVVLSAQATDKSVNQATESLFKIAKTPEQMLELGCNKLEKYIKHIGLYRTKARHVIKLSEILVNEYKSNVPLKRELLEKLPGVGRKTANVVLNNLCGIPYIAVDTHVKRLAYRLQFSTNTDPIKIETDLYKIIPEEFHNVASDLLVLHGRYICTARQPKCSNCVLNDICQYINSE